MGFKIREMNTEGKFCQALTVEALSRAIPPDTIREVLQKTVAGQTRERKLTLSLVVWLVIALHVYTTLPMGAVLAKLARGLRLLWPDPCIRLPTESSLTYRRYQVGARPLARLFRQVCQPIATQETRGAFLFGLRSMAPAKMCLTPRPMRRPSVGTPQTAEQALSLRSRSSIWPSVARTPSSMRASGPAIPVSVSAGSA